MLTLLAHEVDYKYMQSSARIRIKITKFKDQTSNVNPNQQIQTSKHPKQKHSMTQSSREKVARNKFAKLDKLNTN